MTRNTWGRLLRLGIGVCGMVGGWPIGSSTAEAVATRSVSSPFVYGFQSDGVLEETGAMADSSSPYWWVNSGGRLIIKNGTGRTIQGELSPLDRWRILYAVSNPVDTDTGLHPQNIFRLVTRSRWEHFAQSVAFRLMKLHVSASLQRDGWSGVLLFNRYLDGDNLYYLGVRHDGNGVIKKKRYGLYHTLAEKRVFPAADASYERDTNPNFMPGKRWMGLKSVVRTNPDGTVTLQLWIDRQLTGKWELALETVDTNDGADGAPILGSGYAGLRTDYADVEFDDYRAERLY